MKYRAVLFDLDGTLLDTIEDLGDSMNTVLNRYGFPVHNLERYKYFVGDGIENMVKRALPDGEQNEELIKKCVGSMREEYDIHFADKTHPYEGIPELLDSLTDIGIKMTILSNKPDDFTNKMVDKLLSEWHFDMVAGERASIPRKPDPAAAIEITKILGLLPAEFLYLGDTATDMKTATSAGMYPVGALWGFRTADELMKSGAKTLIIKPITLLELL